MRTCDNPKCEWFDVEVNAGTTTAKKEIGRINCGFQTKQTRINKYVNDISYINNFCDACHNAIEIYKGLK